MKTMIAYPVRAAALLMLVAGSAWAQQGRFVTPRADRLTDEVIAADLSRLDSLESSFRSQSRIRSAMLVALAKEAYERNDQGTLTEQLISDARTGGSSVPRTRRPDMWATIDSARRTPEIFINPNDAVAKERELLRAQFMVLGAPNCDAHEAEAGKYILRLKPPVVIADQPPPRPRDTVVTPPPAPEKVETPLPMLVHFALDKYFLSTNSKLVLDTVVKEVLANYPDVSISVNGHTDQRQTLAYNDTLSQNRARSVLRYLVSRGIPASRLTTRALSKRQLENDVPDVPDWARNRRVELVYTRPSGKPVPTTKQYGDLQYEKRRKK